MNNEEKAWLSENKNNISLWFNNSFPPMEFADENGKFTGMGADIIKLLEKRLDIKFKQNLSDNWNNHLQALKSGECAAAPVIVKTTERSENIYFTDHYAKVPVAIISASNSPSGIEIKDLKGLKVGVVSGYATEKYLIENCNDMFEIVLLDNVLEGIQATAFGQIDAFVENLAVASYYITSNGITNLKVSGITDFEFKFSIGISKKYPLLFSSINKTLKSIPEKEINSIRNKWISLSYKNELSPQTILLLKLCSVFLLLLISGLILISVMLKKSLREKIKKMKEAQIELIKSESRFRAFFTNATIPLLEVDQEHGIIKTNKYFTRVFGYEKNDIRTVDDWWNLAFPEKDYRQSVKKQWEKALENAFKNNYLIKEHQFKISCKNGEQKDIAISAGIIEDRILASLFDLTDLNKTKSDLEKSLRVFETLFDLLPFSCVISTIEGRYIMANDFFCKTADISKSEIKGKSMADIGRAVNEETLNQIVEELIKSGELKNKEITIIDKKRKQTHILFSSTIIDWHDEKAVLTATIDITDRKKAADELAKSEENLRVTLNSIGDAVIATDTKGIVTRINPVASSLTDWTPEDAKGKYLKDVFKIISAKTREVLESPVEKVLEKGEIVGLANHTMLISKNGREFHISDSGAPIKNDNNEIIGVVLVFRDVTEEYTLQEKLRQSQKMDAIGQLAGGIAHDFNNMLGGIMGAVQILEKYTKNSPKSQKFLNIILDASVRAADLTSKLLAFARKQPEASTSIPIHKPLKDAYELVEKTIDKRIKIIPQLSNDNHKVIGDPSQLQSAFINILINASHAIQGGGTITITTGSIVVDSKYCLLSQFDLSPGNYVEISISDTGKGISPEHIEKIFEPFFTTKKEGEGTGLGLSAVLGTVQQHKGEITVKSQINQGTVFKILLPLSSETQIQDQIEKPVNVSGKGKILIVDDEHVIRITAQAILENLGYEIKTAVNGKDALEVIKNSPDNFDLVLLDMIMPEMNGKECFIELKKINPEIKVVLSSGFSREEDIELMRSLGIKGFLKKPFTGSELGIAVKNAI